MAVLLQDAFSRTSNTSAGTAPTGQTYTADSGTWGTDGSQLYCVSANDGDTLSVNPGAGLTQDAQVRIAVASNAFPGLMVNYVDTGNYFRLEVVQDGSGTFERWISNGGTVLKQYAAGVFTNNMLIRIVADASSTSTSTFKIYAGTTLLDTVSDATSGRARGNKIALRNGFSGTGSCRFDDLTVSDLTPPVVNAAAAPTSSSTLAATSSLAVLPKSALTSTSSTTSASSKTVLPANGLSAASSLSGSGTLSRFGAASTTASSQMSSTTVAGSTGSAALLSSSAMVVSSTQVASAASSALASTSTLNAAVSQVVGSTNAGLATASALSAAAQVSEIASASLVMMNVLSAAASVSAGSGSSSSTTRLAHRWNGAALVQLSFFRWNGTSLTQTVLNNASSTGGA